MKFIKKDLIKIAALTILCGMLLMSVGSDNPENRFGFLQISLAPIILLLGYGLMVLAILKNRFE